MFHEQPIDTYIAPTAFNAYWFSKGDQYKVWNWIESHIESLMYDAAIENYKNTIKSRKDRKNVSIKNNLIRL